MVPDEDLIRLTAATLAEASHPVAIAASQACCLPRRLHGGFTPPPNLNVLPWYCGGKHVIHVWHPVDALCILRKKRCTCGTELPRSYPVACRSEGDGGTAEEHQ